MDSIESARTRRLLLAHVLQGRPAAVPRKLRREFDPKSSDMIAPHVTVTGPCKR